MSESGGRILLIDDEEVVLDSCRAILEGSDFEVVAVTGGAEGLEEVRRFQPDLVFVDLKMPGMSGMEVLDAIRVIDATIVCVVFTGFATIAAAVEAMQRGAWDFLPKPFTPDDFRLMIRRGLEWRHLVVEAAALRREREALRENFAAIVSHELRSPLGAIQQNLFVLLKELAGVVSADQQRRLERMSTRLGDLLALVNRWLRGFSVDFSNLRESFAEVAVAGPVAEAVESAQAEATRKAVEIEVDADPEAVVWGDAGTLTEALLNVIGNAVKYSREGGRVQVSAGRRDEKVVVSVADSGVGIPEADLPHLFDAFYRGQAASSGVGGAGIGLAVTRRIVEAHGGTITATSDPGRGSTFVIALPALGAPAAAPDGMPSDRVSKGEAG
ncbi:MAG: hybrid sensor histidine kinase/response regulator [Acidimicrobiia bacterium]|nr:hybrid sensor histidine kinase/response regulator [Acidimicrobiia bacterium]